MARCDQCGAPGWENRDGYECKKCGFKKIANTLLDPGTLVFCEGCGCTYLNKCNNGHSSDYLTPVEYNKPPKS